MKTLLYCLPPFVHFFSTPYLLLFLLPSCFGWICDHATSNELFASCLQVFCKICVLKSFLKFIGKHLCWKVLQPATLYEKVSGTYISLRILRNFQFVLNFKSSCFQVFCKIGVRKCFTKFTGKHLCQSVFLVKLQVRNLQLYFKRDSATSDFLWI